MAGENNVNNGFDFNIFSKNIYDKGKQIAGNTFDFLGNTAENIGDTFGKLAGLDQGLNENEFVELHRLYKLRELETAGGAAISPADAETISRLEFIQKQGENQGDGINLETGLSGIGNLLQGAGGLYGAYIGNKQYNLAEDSFDFQADAFNKNRAASIADYNNKNEQEYVAAVSGTGRGSARGYDSLGEYKENTNLV